MAVTLQVGILRRAGEPASESFRAFQIVGRDRHFERGDRRYTSGVRQDSPGYPLLPRPVAQNEGSESPGLHHL